MPAIMPNETREQYISRCIPIVIQEGTASNVDQAYVICDTTYSQQAQNTGQINYTDIINNISF